MCFIHAKSCPHCLLHNLAQPMCSPSLYCAQLLVVAVAPPSLYGFPKGRGQEMMQWSSFYSACTLPPCEMSRAGEIAVMPEAQTHEEGHWRRSVMMPARSMTPLGFASPPARAQCFTPMIDLLPYQTIQNKLNYHVQTKSSSVTRIYLG